MHARIIPVLTRSALLAALLLCAPAALDAQAAQPAPVAPHAPEAPAGPHGGAALAPAPAAPVEAAAAERSETVARLLELARTDSAVMAHLDALVNGIGPRLTGSQGLRRAEEWAVEQFQSFGLPARLEAWGEAAVGFDRGPSSGAAFRTPDAGGEPQREPLEFLSYAWTPGTDGPLRAPAVLAPATVEELDARAEDLRGCWVLFDGSSAATRLVRSVLETRARALELAGFVQAGAERDRLLMSGRLPASLDELPAVPRIAVLRSQYLPLVAALRAGTRVELEFDIDNRAVAGPIPQHNVIADLIGHERPDEFVIVGGHLDSWDGATGTNDNGTGVATTLEAARLLAASGARPRRTIRFMLWGGEEQGLHGSRAWVAAHPDVLPSISAVLVHDGGTNAVSGLGITARMRPQMEAATADAAAFAAGTGGAFGFALHEVPGLDAGGASDHVPYIAAGVPGFFWSQTGEADYGHTHHTQHDTFDAARAADQQHSAVIIALTALGLADLPGLLDRKHLVPQRRLLGVMLGDDGVTVRDLAPGLQAEAAGVQAGDVIVSVNGGPVTPGALGEQLATGEPRKLVGWKRGEALHAAVFAWDPGDIDRAPEPVTLRTAEGEVLRGDAYMGATGAPADGSALVLLPMQGGTRGDWASLREPLHRAGIATLALDPRGHGESIGPDGAWLRRAEAGDPALVAAMADDVTAAVAWLEARGYPPARIGLMGAGSGVAVALHAAARDARLAGVAALTPGTQHAGLDSLADIARWDSRPLLLVSGRAEADAGAAALLAALLASQPWAAVRLVQLDQPGLRGTELLGAEPGIEQQLAAWWQSVLR